MEQQYKRISQLENYLSTVLAGAKVSSNIFVGQELPATINSEWEDMVLVDCNSQTDWGSHTHGSVNIILFARPRGAKLVKNVKLLDKMESKLDGAIGDASDGHFVINGVNWRDHGYNTTRNLHFVVVNIKVVVK